MKRFLCFMILCLPLITPAQEGKGIKWTTGLSWEQVKQKAKTENKYIFLDVMATWCAPCKEMDKNVFTNDSVADYFNKHFISVKLQMDITKNDDEQVKSWYKDAEALHKQYDIQAFPSLLFFNPQGTATELQRGYRNANEFLTIATVAMQPGKLYSNTLDRYNRLVADYRKGNINYNELPFMIEAASRMDTALRSELMNLHKAHVASLKPKDRYSKNYIEFWASLNLSTKSQLFQYFIEDGKIIDKIIGQEGYSAAIVDKTIQREIVIPFFIEQNKSSIIPMSGSYLAGTIMDSLANAKEANWNSLARLIQQQFKGGIVERNLLLAKIEWYLRNANLPSFITHSLMRLEKYPPSRENLPVVNQPAWLAFETIIDKEILNVFIKWMKKVVAAHPYGHLMDTYASLLYKVGRKEEAIYWEKKALQTDSPGQEGYAVVLEQMKKGQPIKAGYVNWEGINTVNWDGVKFKKGMSVVDDNGIPLQGVKVVNNRTGESKLSDRRGWVSFYVSLGDKISFPNERYHGSEVTITKDPSAIKVTLKSIK